MINENFLESDLGGEENREIISDASDKLVNEEIELVKPIMDEFESNVDEEEQDDEKIDEAAFSEDKTQNECSAFGNLDAMNDTINKQVGQNEKTQQIEASLDSDVEETEEKASSPELESDSEADGVFSVVTMEPQGSGLGDSTDNTNLLQQEISGVMEVGTQEQDVQDLLDLPQQDAKTLNDQENHLEDQFGMKQDSSATVMNPTYENETLEFPAQPEEQVESEDEMIKDVPLEKEQELLSENDSDEEEKNDNIADFDKEKETTYEDKEVIQSESEEEKNENSFIQKEMEIQPEIVQEDIVAQAKLEEEVPGEMNSEEGDIKNQAETEDSEIIREETLITEEEIVQTVPEEVEQHSAVPEEKIFFQFDSEELENINEERKEVVDICVVPSDDDNDNEAVENAEIKEEGKDIEETEIKSEIEEEYEKVESQIPSIEISQELETIETTDEVTIMANEAAMIDPEESRAELLEEQTNEAIDMMKDKNMAPPTERFDSDEKETIEEIIITKEPEVGRFEEKEDRKVSEISVELVEETEQSIDNVQTEIETEIEPVEVQADAEKSEACNDGAADDVSMETAEDNHPVLSDKITNDDKLDNKQEVEVPQSAPPQEILKVNEEVEVKDQVTEAAVVTAVAVGAVGAVGAVRNSPKPPTTLALTKTTSSKPQGKPKETGVTKAPAKSRLTSTKPLVPPTSRPSSAVTSRTTTASRPTSRPATAPQRPQRPSTRPSSATTAARPGVQSTKPTITARPARTGQPEAKAPGKTTPPVRPSGTASLKMKLTPRPTSTSRLREASAARVKAATPTTSKPSTPATARTPLSQRVTASQTRTKTPTKPSAASASAKELPNTPFARARQARLAAKEKQKTQSNTSAQVQA